MRGTAGSQASLAVDDREELTLVAESPVEGERVGPVEPRPDGEGAVTLLVREHVDDHAVRTRRGSVPDQAEPACDRR
ncbi:hypothetical protein SCALM49S_06429 [Streptomyces californicus]